jgi:hypothetical protein
MTTNPVETDAFTLVGLICLRFRHMDRDATITAIAAPDGTPERLTYGHLCDLLSAAFDAGDRLKRLSAWHSRESGSGGLVGDFCVECGNRWPCDSRKLADGTYTEADEAGR